MKQKEIEEILSQLGIEIYSFAYILIPDDLQAHQIVVDSIGALIITKKEYLDSLIQIKKVFFENEKQYLKLQLYKNVYDLSRKRVFQIKKSIDSESFTTLANIFYKLEFDEKALLYLKDKKKWNTIDLEFICSKNKAELLSILYAARFKLNDSLALLEQSDLNKGKNHDLLTSHLNPSIQLSNEV